MSKYYYASPKFPFGKVFPLGIVIVIVAVMLLTLGLVDVIYTHLTYVGSACGPLSYTAWQCPTRPCDSASIPWTLVATGIWSAVMLLIAGACSTSLMYASGTTIKCKRDATAVLSGLFGFPIGPLALIICALRIYYMNGVFFCLNGGVLKVADYVEFVLPILIVVNVFLGWCLAVAVLVSICRKGNLTERDSLQRDFQNRYPGMANYTESRKSYRRPFVYPAPSEQPAMLPAPTMWRDRSQAYQNPYMLSRGQPYFYQTPRTRSYPYASFPRMTPPRRYYTAETTYTRY